MASRYDMDRPPDSARSTLFRDRELLRSSEGQGVFARLRTFAQLSGPGWLQSAITLGGGSLVGALYLGMLGGTELLWLQVVAILIGVIMLSAISHVTLSTNVRPYAAINRYVNPVLGVGWLTATMLANMIWILPQFSLCYDALDRNLVPGGLGPSIGSQLLVSLAIAIAAVTIVIMSFNPGWMSRLFDVFLKTTIMIVLLCFVAVVVCLSVSGELDWGRVASGLIPDLSLWNQPVSSLRHWMTNDVPVEYWSPQLVDRQREAMISVTATAVGLNMTFLLPYSMLARGWDRPFRGLAVFDLVVGLAIPFLIVTSCIVIASSHAFHGKADDQLLSDDPDVIRQSVLFPSLLPFLPPRMALEDQSQAGQMKQLETEIDMLRRTTKSTIQKMTAEEPPASDLRLNEALEQRNRLAAGFLATLSPNERRVVVAMVKPDAAQLSATLQPVFGETSPWARWLLGIGALGMGFSTIIILALTNSLAFAELSGRFEALGPRVVGAVAAVVIGIGWFVIWNNESKTYLVIVASTFGAILLPIAYTAFFALLNSTKLLGSEKPRGLRMAIWNVLMTIGVIGAGLQAYGGIATRLKDPIAGPFVIGGSITFLLLAAVGFSARRDYGISHGVSDGRHNDERDMND